MSDTNFPRISARKLLNIPPADLDQYLGGYFYLVFDDGELLTSVRPTIYSAYGWRIIQHYPNIPLSKRFHLSHYHPVKPGEHSEKLVGAEMQTKMLGEIVNDWFDYYPNYHDDDKMFLVKLFFEAVNTLYNELQLKSEEYVGSSNILHLVELINYPPIRDLRTNTPINQRSIMDIQKTIGKILKTDPALRDNQTCRFLRTGLTKESQVVKCIGPWGYPRDIDEYVFPLPIIRGYAEGIRSFRDTLLESRTASKALHLAGPALQNTEYFSRRVTIAGMQLERLHRVDCGSTEYQHKLILSQEMLKLHEGKWYYDKETKSLKDLKRTDTHLIGKLLKFRYVGGCQHPDPNGICEVCYGKMSRNIFKRTNVGSQSTTSTTGKNTQNILSNKHDVAAAVVQDIVLDAIKEPFFTVIGGNGYGIRPDRKGKINKLIIKKAYMVNITDVLEDVGLKNITPSRVTCIGNVKLVVGKLDKNGEESLDQEVAMNFDMVFQHRLAYLTRHMLEYIKQHGWSYDRSGNYIIDLHAWDHSLPIMKIPEKVLSTMDFSKDLENYLEGNAKAREERAQINISDYLAGFYDLATLKLGVNASVLDTMAYASCVVDDFGHDASLPKPWTTGQPGINENTMLYRSLSVGMSYQGHKRLLTNAISFLSTNRPDHVMDWMFTPDQIMEHQKKQGQLH